MTYTPCPGVKKLDDKKLSNSSTARSKFLKLRKRDTHSVDAGGQNWTYIRRLTISRPVMGTVFCALSIEGGPRAYVAPQITFFIKTNTTEKSILNHVNVKKSDFFLRAMRAANLCTERSKQK